MFCTNLSKVKDFYLVEILILDFEVISCSNYWSSLSFLLHQSTSSVEFQRLTYKAGFEGTEDVL